MSDEVICSNCNLPVFPISLRNKDRKTWCSCHKVGLPDGWWLNRYGGRKDGRKEDKYKGRRS